MARLSVPSLGRILLLLGSASALLSTFPGRAHPHHRLGVSLPERTLECLDFSVIGSTLRNLSVTHYGRSIADQRYFSSSSEVSRQYAMVEELLPHVEMLPLRNEMNIWPILRMIELNTQSPEQDDLAYFSQSIEDIESIRGYLQDNEASLTLFEYLKEALFLPEELKDTFLRSFDDDGNLNAEKYPTIDAMRKDIARIRGQIIQTMDTLIKSPFMRDKLADSGFIEYEGRYCLMLKNTYKKGVGIVHSSSNTGHFSQFG